MTELIIFIVIVVVIIRAQKNKTGKSKTSRGSASAADAVPTPNKPRVRRIENLKPSARPNNERRDPPLESLQPQAQKKGYKGKANRTAHYIAQRYESWEPVPQGKRVCRCGYCGAESLIPASADQSDYGCSFCHEDL